MGVLVYTMACNDCGSATRIEVIGSAAKHPTKQATFYCPCCGGDHTNRKYVNGMDDDEYFYWLADSCGLPRTKAAAELTKSIFASWDTDEYKRFMDYYKALMSEEEEK